MLKKVAIVLLFVGSVMLSSGIYMIYSGVSMVHRYIDNSLLKSYSDNLQRIVDTITENVNAYNESYQFNAFEYLVVPISCVELEKGSNTKSPFGNYLDNYSYVVVTRKRDQYGMLIGYKYYVQAIDDEGYGIKITNIDHSVLEISKTNEKKLIKINNGNINIDSSIIPELSSELSPKIVTCIKKHSF